MGPSSSKKENAKSSVKVEKLMETSLVIGEGPHWDDRTQALYFVSISEKLINKYDPATGEHTSTTLEGQPGFIVPLEDHQDQFVVGLEREFVVIQWDGAADSVARVVRKLGEVDQHAAGNRINDGKADPRGRLYAGTMDSNLSQLNKTGSLFRLDARGIKTLVEQVSVSNGLAWDLAAKALYYIATPERKIRRYDYDVESGDISNMQYIFDLDQSNIEGFPDGCTIDTNGNLWVCVFGSGSVLNVSPKGELLRKVDIPAKQVTSCTFGGADLDTLFVTTARLNYGGEQLPPAGCCFKVTGLGVKGHPNNRFKDVTF